MGGIRADCRAPVKAATAKGHTLKHARAHKAKHHHTTKHHPAHHVKHAVKHAHHVHAKAKHATHAKARGLALVPGDVACCTAEALGASLRLQGLSVTDGGVLDLFRLAGGDEDAGAPIVAMLEAASAFGLAGWRLAGFGMAWRDSNPRTPAHSAPTRGHISAWAPAPDSSTAPGHPFSQSSALILGLELPGPHAVLATPEGWWSWGQLWCPWCEFPDAVIEEAWAVTWAVAA